MDVIFISVVIIASSQVVAMNAERQPLTKLAAWSRFGFCAGAKRLQEKAWKCSESFNRELIIHVVMNGFKCANRKYESRVNRDVAEQGRQCSPWKQECDTETCGLLGREIYSSYT